MNENKVTYNAKSRKDFSNPYKDMSHEELLKKAGGKSYEGNYVIEDLPNGKIRVKSKPKSKHK